MADKDEKKDYARPNPLQIAGDEIAFHFDEMCKLINEHFGSDVLDLRQSTIVKLKLEEAMVWMLHTGIIRKQPPPGTGSAEDRITQLTNERDGEREAREKVSAALRDKDAAMTILFERLRAAGVDVSDLIP